MAIYQRGKGFLMKRMFNGETLRAQFDTKAEATAFELQCEAAFELGQPFPDPRRAGVKSGKVQTIQELVDWTIKEHWEPKKADTSMSKCAQQFANWAGPKVPVVELLTRTKINEYVKYRETVRKNADSTINRQLSAISTMMTMARELTLLTGEAFDLPWRREAEGRLRYYEREEEQAMFEMCSRWGYDNERLLFEFLIDTGCRLGEAQRVPWKDIKGRQITFHGSYTKWNITRHITATPRVLEVLAKLKVRGTTGPFHDAPWAQKAALHKGVWPFLRSKFEWMDETTVIHTFRHTCASRLVQAGADAYHVMEWMGHKSLTTTKRYAHLAPKNKDRLADLLTEYGQPALSLAKSA